jgi:hypothetical protein
MVWLLDGETKRRSDMKHTGGHDQTHLKFYIGGNRACRPESHLTCVYNPYFEGLSDGALFVIGRRSERDRGGPEYIGIIIDSERDDLIQQIHELTDIPSGPSWGIVRPAPETEEEFSEFELPEYLIRILKRKASDIYDEIGAIPTTSRITGTIWDVIREHEDVLLNQVNCRGIHQAEKKYDTAVQNAPGNLIRWMLQNVEFLFFKYFEKLHYPSEIVEYIRSGSRQYPENWKELENSIAVSLEQIVETAKSVTQSRRSRAGVSFQNHISRLLKYHDIQYEPESGERRIDFLIRNGKDIKLSAKTSIRERWKQVYDGSYFITLDRQVTESKLENITKRDIKLVVPEEDKSDIGHYQNTNNVLSIREFLNKIRKEAV